MKKLIKLKVVVLILFSSQVYSSNSSSIEELNFNISNCYQQTTKGVLASKRSCNAVIRANITSLENKAIAYHNRGVINLYKGNIENALSDFKRAVRLNPELTDTQEMVVVLINRIKKRVS